MKKFFSFVAAILFAGSMMAQWSEITFTAATAAGAFNDSVFAAGDFKLTCVDTDNSKLKTTANTSYFGTSEEDKVSYGFRLQTSGKSSAKNALNLTIPEAGQLRIAVRTGSNDATDRTLVLTQGETELYNQPVVEADTLEGLTSPRIYKYITVNVQAGTVAVTYPINALNFYAFAFKADGGETPVDPQPADPTNCAEAAEAALSVSANNEYYNDSAVYSIPGYVTEIAYAWSNGSMSFWMADTKDGGKVLEAYKCAIADQADAVRVGDKVTVTGALTKYNTTPEFGAGCTVVINERSTDPVVVDTLTCAEVYSKAKNDEVVLKEVVVTFANGKNVWVKDETASMLIYLSADATWQAGDVLSGVAGVVDIYNGIHEVKPSADQAAAVVATPGEAPAAEVVATVAASDVNKYIVMKGVEAEGAFAEGTQSNITINGVTVRNQFKNAYTFEAGKKYDVYGVVSLYQNNPQVYFITAEEAKQEGIENVELTEKASKVVVNGMLYIIRDGKMFNATGAQVK